MSSLLASLVLRYERDIVVARQKARQIAARLGFDGQDQSRISTAVSEIGRNAYAYAHGGSVEFALEGRTAPQVLAIRVADQGPGIADLTPILEGRFRSESGMGLGILGARRLMDQFEIHSTPTSGTTVVLRKLLPRGRAAFGASELEQIRAGLAAEEPRDAMEEVQRQNQELLRALAELTRRQEELSILNRELEDTNRGVVALYAELDEKADHLRRADEIKTRFISNMTHEFRTPVNSIQALAGLLLDRTDGDLTPEQERQVAFIRKSADALSELVNDLLDLAKVEAGKSEVRPTEFRVSVLFGTLRGMLKPLLVNESLRLSFDEADDLPPLHTDESKVSQILRNFISNALKFTERGEVRVSARLGADRTTIVFAVADTGIGIAREDQERVFQEFAQIENPIQRRVKGTGLGLPLCRRLAVLLGGSVSVSSTPGVGSEFRAEIPIVFATDRRPNVVEWNPASRLIPILALEDDEETLLLYEKYLQGSRFGLVPARSVHEAREALKAVSPAEIVLDILLRGEDAWSFLTEIKRRVHAVPVLVVSTVEDEAKATALGADAYLPKPLDRATLLRTLGRLAAPRAVRRILVVDDDEISRYLLRQSLQSTPHEILEAGTGREGLRLAEEERPDLVFLDLVMPDLSGAQVLARLHDEPATRRIPVVILTSHRVDESMRSTLSVARTVVRKDEVSPERLQAVLEETLAIREAS